MEPEGGREGSGLDSEAVALTAGMEPEGGRDMGGLDSRG